MVPLTFVVVFINAEQQQKNNDHDVASLVAEMKTKLDTLGVKVESQAVRIDKLENELTKANEKIDQLLMESNDDDHVNSKSSPAQIIKPQSLQTQYRSCHEFYSATLRNYKEIGFEGVPIKSGMFYIDLDGQGVGEPPIYVYCNMTDGTTSIGHDITDEVVTVDKCPTAGCFSREITYDASPTQLESLVRMSDRCTQQIKIDCFSVPLEYNGVQYAWWVDRRGSPRYFWSGNQSNAMAVDRRSNHTCQCGIDYNENKQSSSSCVDLNHKCQCDSLAPVALSDDGLISDKDLLPVTRLHFGRTAIPRTLIKFTLGRLNCKGQNSLSSGDGLISSNDELPTNCDQLRSLGHRLPGFYSVKDGDQIKTVFCRAASLSYGNTPVPAAALQSQRPNIATDGKPSVTGPMPTDCDGAKALGWTHSGFYTVKGSTAQLKTVYCNFTKIAGATGRVMLMRYAVYDGNSIRFVHFRIRDADWLQRHQNCQRCLFFCLSESNIIIIRRCNGNSLSSVTAEYRRCDEFGDGRLHCIGQRALLLQCLCTFVECGNGKSHLHSPEWGCHWDLMGNGTRHTNDIVSYSKLK